MQAPIWQPLADISLTSASAYYFDISQPLPIQRFMRTRQTALTSIPSPKCQIQLVPALAVHGEVGHSMRIDYIDRIGPTNAWVTLDNITLTNVSQYYFDVSAPNQPSRLYRLVALP